MLTFGEKGSQERELAKSGLVNKYFSCIVIYSFLCIILALYLCQLEDELISRYGCSSIQFNILVFNHILEFINKTEFLLYRKALPIF